MLMNIHLSHADHHQEVPSLHRALSEVRREKVHKNQASGPNLEWLLTRKPYGWQNDQLARQFHQDCK